MRQQEYIDISLVTLVTYARSGHPDMEQVINGCKKYNGRFGTTAVQGELVSTPRTKKAPRIEDGARQIASFRQKIKRTNALTH